MRNDGMLSVFDGVFPGNPGREFLNPYVADISKTYPQAQPEQDMAYIETYRTGHIVRVYQDLESMAYNNTYPYVTYPPNWKPAYKTAINDVYANILNSPGIPGK